jgi:hypothetical protein
MTKVLGTNAVSLFGGDPLEVYSVPPGETYSATEAPEGGDRCISGFVSVPCSHSSSIINFFRSSINLPCLSYLFSALPTPSPISRPLLITRLNRFIAWRSSILLSPLVTAPNELPLPLFNPVSHILRVLILL